MLKPLTNDGIESLGDLVQAYEYEQDGKNLKLMKNILGTLPKPLIEIATCFNENINDNSQTFEYIMMTMNGWSRLSDVTVKQLQVTLKTLLNKIECLNVTEKLGIAHFDEQNIVTVRQRCKNTKLRSIYFRLIHNDFFTHKKMKRFNMTESDKCPRCDEIEDMRHLIWECPKVKQIWELYNQVMESINGVKVTNYEDVFVPGESDAVCNVKIKLIQELIQIERPKNWKIENFRNIIINMANIESYTASMKNQSNSNKIKWKQFRNLLQT
jgi:hypothetical protein